MSQSSSDASPWSGSTVDVGAVALTRQALKRLDLAGLDASLAACYLHLALSALGYEDTAEHLSRLIAHLHQRDASVCYHEEIEGEQAALTAQVAQFGGGCAECPAERKWLTPAEYASAIAKNFHSDSENR